jgi:hypothetical protein
MNTFSIGTKVCLTKVAVSGESEVELGETFEGYIVNPGGLQEGTSLMLLQPDDKSMKTSPVVSVAQAPRFQGKEACVFDTQTSRYHCIEL